MTRICVAGIWHQGAVLSACLAELGHDVTGLCDTATAAELNAGRPPVVEPRLPELLRRGLAAGRLRFLERPAEALDGVEFVFLSCDTPVLENDAPDLEPVFSLAETIRDGVSNDVVVCVTAQVPVGTTKAIGRVLSENALDRTCHVAYVPEFLRLGEAVETFTQADRFVVGADDPEIGARVAALLAPLERPLFETDIATAEMAKHASNAFLATSISFMNEVADLCATVGAEPASVADILRADRRIGPHAYLAPGLGFAGGTLGRELRALQLIGSRHDIETPLTDAVLRVNDNRLRLVSQWLCRALGDLSTRRIAVHGLTYKSGTSTLRRSIPLEIVGDLVACGARVSASDPLASFQEVQAIAPGVRLHRDPYRAASGSEALVVLADGIAPALELDRLRAVMRGDLILDARAALEPSAVRQAGFRYSTLWEVPT